MPFINKGFPDLLLVVVYLLYGKRAYEFFMTNVLHIPHYRVFSIVPEVGLSLKHSSPPAEDTDAKFRYKVYAFVRRFHIGGGTVSTFMHPDFLGNYASEDLEHRFILTVTALFTKLAEPQVVFDNLISKRSFMKRHVHREELQ